MTFFARDIQKRPAYELHGVLHCQLLPEGFSLHTSGCRIAMPEQLPMSSLSNVNTMPSGFGTRVGNTFPSCLARECIVRHETAIFWTRLWGTAKQEKAAAPQRFSESLLRHRFCRFQKVLVFLPQFSRLGNANRTLRQHYRRELRCGRMKSLFDFAPAVYFFISCGSCKW